MNQLDPVLVEKTTEESTGWKSKSPIEEMLKDHNFNGVGDRERLTRCGAPPNDVLLWQNKVRDHLLQLLLHHGRLAPGLLWIGERNRLAWGRHGGGSGG